MTKFPNGTLVRLLSGGPVMTVDNTRTDLVNVIWFDAQGQLHEQAFSPICLEQVEKSEAA